MRVSLISCVRDSHEFLRRQVLYMNSLGIADWIEWVIVDHHSTPELSFSEKPNFNAQIVRFDNDSPWMIPSLINFGRKHASGDYLMKLDIDHMISKHWIKKFAETSCADFAHFPRIYALLDKNGVLQPYIESTIRVIFKMEGTAGTSWVKASVFDDLGGYDERFDGIGFGADLDFKRRYILMFQDGDIMEVPVAIGPYIYMLPEKPHPVRPSHLLHNFIKKGEHGR